MTKNKILLISSLTFLAMLILSIVYYKERTCFVDISFHLFYILKDGSFAMGNYRFGAFFTQLFPLIGGKLGLSLNTIAMAYSMSFVILPFLTFAIILLGLKNKNISIAYLLFVTLMTTHTFYWIQSELPQAIAFLFILIALLENTLKSEKVPSPFFWVIICALSFIVCFTHPLILFPISFIVIYFYFVYPQQRNIILSIGLLDFIFIIIKNIFFQPPYDSQAMGGIKNFATLFPNYFNLQSNKNLVRYFVFDYYMVVIMLISNVIFYLKKKQHVKMLLLISFFAGFSFIVNISNPNGAVQFYLENQYLILAFIVALPFALDVLPQITNSNIQYSILCLICVVSIFRIANAHSLYTNRLNWNRNLLSKTEMLPNKKLIIPNTKAPIDTLLMTWGSAYELWLLSTLEKGSSRSIIIEENPNEFDLAIPSSKSFIGKWGVFNYSDLNKKYFNFTDTTGYVKMN